MLDRGQEFVGVDANLHCKRADVGARVDAGGEPLELAGIDPPKHGGADAGPLLDVAQLQAGGEPCLPQRGGGGPSHRVAHRIWSPSEVLLRQAGTSTPPHGPHYAPLLTSAEA